MKHSRFGGFNVITSHRCKDATAEESCYSNAFFFLSLSPLSLSFPPS